ncbi:MAG: DUF1801 domain-containing protein [Ferruginibacter sp.]|nr:DUF1801 domain-containing protein [Ferruginibacter sp.]
MNTAKAKPTTIDEYIALQDEKIQPLLQEIRAIIKKAAPKSTEVISYAMPAFKLKKILIYFAGYKSHIGFYPHGSPIIAFKKELAAYKTSKGAIQFPLDKPLPKKLITAIVKFRLAEEAAAIK